MEDLIEAEAGDTHLVFMAGALLLHWSAMRTVLAVMGLYQPPATRTIFLTVNHVMLAINISKLD